MGLITRSFANNIGSSGILKASAVTNATVEDITSFDNAVAGTLILLSTQTASSSANISFTTGLDSTYDEYQFHFINIHPATDSVQIQFNGSTDSGSNYNVTKTTTFFKAEHNEADTGTGLGYDSGLDLAQSTAFQSLSASVGNDADQNISGFLQLFNPSSTTYVKHFISHVSTAEASDYLRDDYVAGYFNTTSAINAIQFKMSSGNIDDGIIKLYGVKKS